VEAAKAEAKAMRESAEALLKTNPWLDEYAESSIGASERMTVALEEHADALRRQMDALAASHRSAMADMASVQAPAEAAPARDDATVAQLKSSVNELRDDHQERWKKVERDLAVLSDVARRVDTFGDDLEALNLKLAKEMDESGGSKKMKENLKVLTGMIEALEAEVNALRDDVKVSQEIKDTLFRDSKRLHNMHERLNAMELQHEGDDDAKVAELKKRIDAMERRMTSEISIAVSEALAASGMAQPAPKPKPAPRKR
jgi:chromosome segregation ATPase